MHCQKVVIGNTFSNLTAVVSSIHQGMVLGPTSIDNHHSKIRLFKPCMLACGWHTPDFLKSPLCMCMCVCIYVHTRGHK